MVDVTSFGILAFLIIVIVLIIFARTIHTVQPYQQGLVVLFGSYKRLVNPGLVFVHPLARVIPVDLRPKTQELALPNSVSPDGTPYRLDLRFTTHIADAPRSVFQVANVREAVAEIAGREARALVATLSVTEINLQRVALAARLKDALQAPLSELGVAVDDVDIVGATTGVPPSFPPRPSGP